MRLQRSPRVLIIGRSALPTGGTAFCLRRKLVQLDGGQLCALAFACRTGSPGGTPSAMPD